MESDKKRVLVSVLAVVIVASAGSLLACFEEAQEGGNGDRLVGARGILLASNRTELSLCVDGAGGVSVSDDDLQRVENALEGAIADSTGVPSEFNRRTVSLGCPPPVALTGKQLDKWHRYGLDVPARLVGPDELPSPYRIAVYVVAADTFTASFGGDPYATTAEERICEGDVCQFVVEGLYVTPSATPETLQQAIADALGLLPPQPEPTFDFQTCALGTPDRRCARYEECRLTPELDPACDELWREFDITPPPQ